ncbi:MAG TPA: phospholipase D-like domain-containing protein [Acidimicrobiales bacterium]|nr:phospholipase D-like domain-containing protein [Acidimicrobiales bacterium]
MPDVADPVGYRRALEGLLGVPATAGNQVDVLRNGDRIFPAMFDAIEAATSTIDFLTFVYWRGSVGQEMAALLAAKARAGVRVRVILDAVGAFSMDRALVDQMLAGGAQVEWFRPVNMLRFWEANHRSHRKVLICDEDVAFTGGIGIADEWRGDARGPGEWRDTHFRIRGPAVDGLRAAFVQNWAETGRPLFDPSVDRFPVQPPAGLTVAQVVRGAAQTGWSDVATLVRALLGLARQRVRITTAYFVPDEATCRTLAATARRGVEVDVLLPGPHVDKRFVQLASQSQYDRLLEAGVRLWSYQLSMLHAKVITVDGMVASVGSANFTNRSLMLDDEVNVVVFDPDIVRTLDEDFEADLAAAEPVDPRAWPDRSLAQRALEAVAGLGGRHM